MYTTAIDRSAPSYSRRAVEAERLAREIEGRGQRDEEVDDGRGEEEKYSGVRRDIPLLPLGGAGSYVPPSRRPITMQPTVPGAPFDPAIISTQKPQPAPAAAPVPAVAVETSKEEAPLIAEAGQLPTVQTLPDVQTQDSKETKPAIPAVKISKQQTPTLELSKTGDPARDVADAFKQFANMEKLKTKDRTQKLQEDRRTAVRHEKNVKLNDLKKFAANFKLKSRVPDDLVPILAKDREKQMEIQKKAEQEAREAEQRQKEKDAEKKAIASPTPSQTALSNMQPFSQQHPRARVSQNLRQPIPSGQSPRGPLSIRTQPNQTVFGQGRIAPLPSDIRIPAAPNGAIASDSGPLSPTSATRLNVKAIEFKPNPGASTFSPTPKSEEMPAAPTLSFFSDKKPRPEGEKRTFSEAFNPLKRMLSEATEEQKKGLYNANGGIPQAYRTPPTWTVPESHIEVSYLDAFPKTRIPSSSASPMHTPIPNGPMQHQLPPHMQNSMGTPQIHTPSHVPGRYYPQQPQHPHPQGSFDGRPNWPQPGSSVQSSPRFQPQQMAFNNQMAPMPPYGQPMPQQFGMSPGMAYRQMPGAPQYMNVPSQQMGGHMMVQQPSGGYANGPMPQSYGGSPRPTLGHQMSHQGSQHGHQPQYMMPPGGPQMMPQPQMSPMPGYAQPQFQHMPQQGQSESSTP